MIPRPGTVYLVGAGPGDPELITVRGLKLLRAADVVIHDRLACRELLREVKPDAECINVGKAPSRHSCSQEVINALLVDRAWRGEMVVRLKGGDPFVFGRGGEEMLACRGAGVPCQVVPGITSAAAAPAAAGIPVTHRELSRSFAVVTGHTCDDNLPEHDFSALARIDTLVILMGRRNLPRLTQGLLDAGRNPDTPAACVERAFTSDQRVIFGSLATIAALADRSGIQSPMTTIIGPTVRLASDPHGANASIQASENCRYTAGLVQDRSPKGPAVI